MRGALSFVTCRVEAASTLLAWTNLHLKSCRTPRVSCMPCDVRLWKSSFGTFHAKSWSIWLAVPKSRIHVVWGLFFSFDKQDLLDEHLQKTTSSVESTRASDDDEKEALEELVEKYHKIGTGGHHLGPLAIGSLSPPSECLFPCWVHSSCIR